MFLSLSCWSNVGFPCADSLLEGDGEKDFAELVKCRAAVEKDCGLEGLGGCFLTKRPWFRLPLISLSALSMGMSSDYVQAIEHGATHVRVGSKIFGARD